MLLSYLMIALSVSFAPLAQGRPAGTPAAPINSGHASTEPGTLLGRPYSIQERRDSSHVRLPRAPYAGYARPDGYRTAESPRRSKPYAKYLADRADDAWVHEHEHEHGRRADAGAPNYVSYVGAPPPPPVEPAKPVPAFVDAVPPTAPAAPVEPSNPVSFASNPTASLSSASLALATSTSLGIGPLPTSSTSAAPTASVPKKAKSTKGKGKSSKTYKSAT